MRWRCWNSLEEKRVKRLGEVGMLKQINPPCKDPEDS